MPPPQLLPAVHTPVVVRIGVVSPREFSTRVEGTDNGLIAVVVPTGGKSALLASGTREVDLSWLSPRGRYEQRCRLDAGAISGNTWQLRPIQHPILIQRRRYIRVRASVDVTIDVAGTPVTGSTVDVSEGGFRVRLPRCDIADSQHTVVRAAIGGADVELPGYVVRTTDAEGDQTEAVIAFHAEGVDADAVRRFVLHRQLLTRAGRDD